MRPTLSGLPKSLAGAGLAAVGAFLLYHNLHGTAAQLARFLGTTCCDAPGAFPTVILAAARVMDAYASGHQRFVEIFIQHLSPSCCALVLMIVGTVWFRDNGRDSGMGEYTPCRHQNDLPPKSVVRVDFSIRGSTVAREPIQLVGVRTDHGPTSHHKETKPCDS